MTTRRMTITAGLLIASGGVVGGAIALGGESGRALNGVGGAGWLIAVVLLVATLRRVSDWQRGFGCAVAVTLGLAWLVSPSDLTAAIVGFGAAGAVVAAATSVHRSAWALLVPALWLPLHVGSAIVRSAIAGEARVRTEPPPTAALVPLAMILAAWSCGLIVDRIATRRPAVVFRRALQPRR